MIAGAGFGGLCMAIKLREAGICFMMATMHHPAMRHVGPPRAELSTRTVFNLLGPLTNPASVRRQLTGAFSAAWIAAASSARAICWPEMWSSFLRSSRAGALPPGLRVTVSNAATATLDLSGTPDPVVAELTGGSLRITPFAGGQIVPAAQAFDAVRGDARIEQGVLRTDNLQMRGINAAVLMAGSADLARETQSLDVVDQVRILESDGQLNRTMTPQAGLMKTRFWAALP